MPAFTGLTREEEEDEEEYARMQLYGLLEHKTESRFFSKQFIDLINPKFRAKKPKDPEWKPGMERQAQARSRRPQPVSGAAPPAATTPAPVVEEELSTNLADFADFFQ